MDICYHSWFFWASDYSFLDIITLEEVYINLAQIVPYYVSVSTTDGAISNVTITIKILIFTGFTMSVFSAFWGPATGLAPNEF